MEHFKKVAFLVFVVMLGIIGTGIFLDEAAKGSFGGFFQNLAKKSTAGYGSLNA